jgi:hypothetical protein
MGVIKRQDAEIERLKKELEEKTRRLKGILPVVASIKENTIKEFAERLHEYINGIIERHEMPMFPFSVAFVSGMETKIDTLVEEMVGEG